MAKKNMQSSVAAWVTAALLLVLIALIFTKLCLLSQNTLLHNGRWIVGKRMAEVGLNGGDQFLINRNSLAAESLHLGEAWGFQQVLSRTEHVPVKVQFNFNLAHQSHLTFFFGADEEGYSGIRLSLIPSHKNILFRYNHKGEVNVMAEFAAPIVPNAWNATEIELGEEGVKVTLNKQLLYRGSAALHLSGRLGFYGGMNDASVDDINITEKLGKTLTEDFSNTHHAFSYFLVSLLIGSFVFSLAYTLGTTSRIYSGIYALLITVFCGTTTLAFDYYYLAHFPLDSLSRGLNGEVEGSPILRLERGRIAFFDAFAQLVGDKILSNVEIQQQGYPPNRIWRGPVYCAEKCVLTTNEAIADLSSTKKNTYRILFSGSSQAFGAGASTLSTAFIPRAFGELIAQKVTGRPPEFLNIAVSGDKISSQFEEYVKINGFVPDLVVLNFSHNDDPAMLAIGMENFMAENERRKIPTLVLLEAYSAETGEKNKGKHFILRAFARGYGAYVFDLHSFMNSAVNPNFASMWWDEVHLNDYGQALAAKELARLLKEIMEKPLSQPSKPGKGS